MEAHTVGLVLADRQQAFAEGLGIILDATDGFAVLGLAHTPARTVQLAAAHRPAVLLLDAHLPGAAAVAAGADGLVTKHGSSRHVVDVIRTVVAGKLVTAVAAEPPRAGGRPSVEALRLGSLSCREREVLGLLARGWSTGRIADGLQVAQCTVRSHVYNLLGKLDLHSRLEAAAFALERDRDQFGELGNARGELLVELLQR